MGSLVCNTPEGARRLTNYRPEVGADVHEASVRSRHNACAPRRGSSLYPGIEAFILRHALQVEWHNPTCGQARLFERMFPKTSPDGWTDSHMLLWGVRVECPASYGRGSSSMTSAC
jgi:hypothetical protein